MRTILRGHTGRETMAELWTVYLLVAGTFSPMNGSPTFMDQQRCQNFVNGANFVLSEQGYNPKYVCWPRQSSFTYPQDTHACTLGGECR